MFLVRLSGAVRDPVDPGVVAWSRVPDAPNLLFVGSIPTGASVFRREAGRSTSVGRPAWYSA